MTTYEGYGKSVEAFGARVGSDQKGKSKVREESGVGGKWWQDDGTQHSPCHGIPWQMDCCQSSTG